MSLSGSVQPLLGVGNPAIPYVAKIPHIIKEDMSVLFQGAVPKNADRFSINFKMGEGTSDDVAFHFNPRIGRYTALNSFRDGDWENEESAPDKPFTEGNPFRIIVAFKSDGYEVYVNRTFHSKFKHRMPLEKVSAVYIRGDVTIDFFAFLDNTQEGLHRK